MMRTLGTGGGGRVRVSGEQTTADDFQRPQLLRRVRQCGSHHGGQHRPSVLVQDPAPAVAQEPPRGRQVMRYKLYFLSEAREQ